MNERLFQRVEVWILDLVIRILSQDRTARSMFRKLDWFEGNKVLIFLGLILGSSFVGLLGGYLAFILTSQVR
jgi:hypothetical protein